jgi:NAD(P)-dependent dehydrogenase (short-subunit alcohol dehydrogenase family)
MAARQEGYSQMSGLNERLTVARQEGHKQVGSLVGQAVLITGGAGLLGVEHAIAVAENGGVPILLDINGENLETASQAVRQRSAGSRVESRIADIRDRTALEQLRDELEATVGAVSCVVNNAAVNPVMDVAEGEKFGAFETYPVAQWSRELEVGLTGALIVTQVFGAAMAERGRGSIVNIASDLGVIAPDHRIYTKSRKMEDVSAFKPVSYSVCKSALIGLTRYVATYWAHRNVRCNALAPGGVYNGQDSDLVAGLEDRIPMRRMAQRDEYHDAIVFLCSNASSYMTGQVLVMDGGRSVW